jgi:hypothetical protein
MIDIYLNQWRTVRRNKVAPQLHSISQNQIKQVVVEDIELIQQFFFLPVFVLVLLIELIVVLKKIVRPNFIFLFGVSLHSDSQLCFVLPFYSIIPK